MVTLIFTQGFPCACMVCVGMHSPNFALMLNVCWTGQAFSINSYLVSALWPIIAKTICMPEVLLSEVLKYLFDIALENLAESDCEGSQ